MHSPPLGTGRGVVDMRFDQAGQPALERHTPERV
jgi:hypothetical protein